MASLHYAFQTSVIHLSYKQIFPVSVMYD